MQKESAGLDTAAAALRILPLEASSGGVVHDPGGSDQQDDQIRRLPLTTPWRLVTPFVRSPIGIAAGALVGGQLIRMLGGVAFWGIATRSFPASRIGIAASAVAALMICVQLAVLGAGSSVIRLYPNAARQGDLLAAAFKLVLIASCVVAGVFILLSAFLLTHLETIGRTPLFASAFFVACMLGACNLLGNEASVAMMRPASILIRAALLSTVMLAIVSAASVALPARSEVIFACWAAGELAAALLLIVHLRARPASAARRLARVKMQQVVSKGVANQVITVADRVPPMLLTILVTQLLSPELSAYWYAAWMAALSVFFIPIYSGTALFADLVRAGQVEARRVRATALRALAVAGAAALGVALLSHRILDFFGRGYAAHGERPLQLLLAAVVSVTVVQTYFAVCRATDHLREAGLTAVVTAIFGLGLAGWFGHRYGLNGVAGAWVGCETAAAVWALWRTRRLTRRPSVASQPARVVAPAAPIHPTRTTDQSGLPSLDSTAHTAPRAALGRPGPPADS
jgi:O-antigen/teichoic acid export membrane protein